MHWRLEALYNKLIVNRLSNGPCICHQLNVSIPNILDVSHSIISDDITKAVWSVVSRVTSCFPDVASMLRSVHRSTNNGLTLDLHLSFTQWESARFPRPLQLHQWVLPLAPLVSILPSLWRRDCEQFLCCLLFNLLWMIHYFDIVIINQFTHW